MKKLKDKIVGIVVFLLCTTFCKQCTTTYIKGGDNKLISNYEKMIFDQSTIYAELYPEYKEHTITVMRVPMKSYEFRYHFELNGEKYEGSHTYQSSIPKTTLLKVYYLKDDPNFNCVNPEDLLKVEKEKNASNSNLYWGIGWGVLALVSLFGLLSKEKTKQADEAN
jgi:hypothetical protein